MEARSLEMEARSLLTIRCNRLEIGPSIEERAILFLEAQDRVKKGPFFKRYKGLKTKQKWFRVRFGDWRLARAMKRGSGLAQIPEPTMVSSRSPRGATQLVDLFDIRWHTRFVDRKANDEQ
ncbi:hypothetical protein Tco_1408361 [Tanacetum coccineum]